MSYVSPSGGCGNVAMLQLPCRLPVEATHSNPQQSVAVAVAQTKTKKQQSGLRQSQPFDKKSLKSCVCVSGVESVILLAIPLKSSRISINR